MNPSKFQAGVIRFTRSTISAISAQWTPVPRISRSRTFGFPLLACSGRRERSGWCCIVFRAYGSGGRGHGPAACGNRAGLIGVRQIGRAATVRERHPAHSCPLPHARGSVSAPTTQGPSKIYHLERPTCVTPEGLHHPLLVPGTPVQHL